MVTLTRIGKTELFQAFVSSTIHSRFCFFPRVSQSEDEIELSIVWSEGGVCIVADADEDLSDLLRVAKTLWQEHGGGKVKIITWKKGQHQRPYLAFDATGKFKYGDWGNNLLTQEFGAINAKSFSLYWTSVSANPDFVVECGSDGLDFFCASDTNVPFMCTLDGDFFNLNLKPVAANKFQFGQIYVSHTKEGSGSWKFEIEHSVTPLFLKTLNPLTTLVRKDKYSLKSNNFSFFETDRVEGLAGVGLEVTMHPYSIHHTHSRFEFTGKRPSFVSKFIDAAGRLVTITATNDAHLRLLPTPKFNGGWLDQAIVCPAGTFAVTFVGTTSFPNGGPAAMEILTGTAGTEFVLFGDGLTSDLPDGITFVPDCPAFIDSDGNGINKLTRKALAAWILPAWTEPQRAQDLVYRYASQPEEAPLFGLKTVNYGKNSETGLADEIGIHFDPAPRKVLGHGQGAMPWLPLHGVSDDDVDKARKLDRDVLVPERNDIASRNLAKQFALPQQSAQTRWVVMPQGFTVLLDDQNRWLRVVFGLSAGELEVRIELVRPMKGNDVVERWPIQESLTRSATFLVATQLPKEMPVGGQPSDIGSGSFLIKVSGWEVKVEVGGFPNAISTFGPGSPPILVVKFGAGKFRELAETPKSWSLPNVLNKDVTQTRAQLVYAIESLERLSKGFTPRVKEDKPISNQAKEEYLRLYKKLEDQDWNGVVLFNAFSNPQELPDGVAALRGGIDKKATFWVPCVGLDLCKVGESQPLIAPDAPPAQQPPPQQVPSAFAGIHYFADNELGLEDLSFDLKLKNLDVILNNSTLRTFVAKADLRMSTFLGAEVKKDAESDGRKNRLIKIEGSYQGRSPDGVDQYVIRALGKQTIQIEQSDLLREVQLNRLELLSTKDDKSGIINGRFAMWGRLTFGSTVVDISGAKSVGFENLAVVMTLGAERPEFKLDAGHVEVDWDSTENAGGQSWLKKFPLQLSGFRWGGSDFPSFSMDPKLPNPDWWNFGECPRLELPDVGFTKFDLSSLMPDLKLGSGFDFGIEFNIDMGGFGSFADAAKLLRGKVLIGWHDFRRFLGGTDKFDLPKFSVGFKFEGGSAPLDIGIQGIFRLRAKKVILKQYNNQELLGIGLQEPQLDILGYTIPDDPKDMWMAVVIEMKKDPQKKNLPTWVFILNPKKSESAGPVALSYFAVGQNAYLINPNTVSKITSVIDAIEKSKCWVEDNFKNEQLQKFRPEDPSGKWNFLASGAIKDDVADVALAFLDDIPLYGLRVKIPKDKSWIEVDVLYKKIADDIGVFSIEVDLKGLRTIEVGAGSITLPVFSFSKFTDGGWSYNFGFDGNNFSKSGSAQFLPFIGSAGLQLGQFSGLSGNFLTANADEERLGIYKDLELHPIYELQVAFRIGLGKEIREGVFSAGASLTAYGIFQGAIATINKASHPSKHGQYIKIAGAAGILLEIFGEVNFAIVSAAVCIRAWVETGLIAETWQPIMIYAEARVSVYVRVVIARFRVFGHTIEIAIHFSFSITLRIGATLPAKRGEDPKGLLGENYPYLESTTPQKEAAPIDWAARKPRS